MATTEDISLRVALDDRQAKAGLDALRSQTDAVAQAADAGAGGMASLTQKVDGINRLAGPAASAISGVTGAVGGLSSQAGAAVGAVANLAGAFASGGPLALGIVAIGTGISWLSTKYAESAKAAEQAEKAQTDAINATAKRIEQLTQGVKGRISGALGIDEATLAMGQLDIKIKNAQASLDDLQTSAGRAEFIAAFVREGGRATDSTDAYTKKLEESKQSLRLLKDEFKKAQPEFDTYNKTLAIANQLEARKKELDDAAKAALTAKTVATKKQTEETFDAIKAVEDLFAAERKAREEREKEAAKSWAEMGPTGEMFQQEQLRQFQEAEKARVEAAKKAADERVKIEEEAAKRTQEIQSKTTQIGVDAASGAVDLLIGTTNDLVIAAVTGQENAAEKASAAFLSGIGSQLVGIGTKALIEGAIISANPLTPGAGAPMMLLGGAAIAAGIGLGAAGAGISASLGAAGSGAATPSATTSTPMGAGRISGRQADGGGNRQEAITYVFNAPVFGDQNRSAKHVAQLQRRARRDLLLA